MSEFAVRTAEQLPTLLQAFRKEAGLTQSEAALRLGVTQQTYSALERNAEKVGAGRLLKLLGILGVELVLSKPGADQNPASPRRGGAPPLARRPGEPMGRQSRTRSLGLWMNGAFVGTWSLAPNTPDTLRYDPAWASSTQGRPLSLSLPFTPGNPAHRGDKVRAYFDNLLPDSTDIRERLARRYKTGTTDAFALLAEIGRDCVGALEILPIDHRAPEGLNAPMQATPLTDAQVAEVLRGTTTPNTLGLVADDDGFRISIAGAQEKTALLRLDGHWCLPRGSTPTTHIFKLPLGLVGGMKIDMRDSVENEWLCSLILKEFGLPVAACQSMRFR